MSKLAKEPDVSGVATPWAFWRGQKTAGFRFLEVLAACWPFQFLDPSHLCWWLRKVKNSQCVGFHLVEDANGEGDENNIHPLHHHNNHQICKQIYIHTHIFNYIHIYYMYDIAYKCVYILYDMWYVFITELQSSANSCDFRMLHVFLCICTLWIETRSICPNESNRPNESIVWLWQLCTCFAKFILLGCFYFGWVCNPEHIKDFLAQRAID